MKFILDNWLLVAVALSSGLLLALPAFKGLFAGGLSAAAAVQLINREKAVVIDVSDAAEFAAGHVVGARHIALAELHQKLPQSVKNKELPLIFVCQSGMRSLGAVRIAQTLGYAQAHSLAGGVAAWRAASLPVEKA